MRALNTEEIQEVSGALTYARDSGWSNSGGNWWQAPEGFRFSVAMYSVSVHDGATWVVGTNA